VSDERPSIRVFPILRRDRALARELAEELGLDVAVGEHIGDVELSATTTLRAYAATLLRGEPRPHDHAALRWVAAADLDDVDWVPADRGFLPALRRLLS
jgi:8-oxo-dGTP diphosphatase